MLGKHTIDYRDCCSGIKQSLHSYWFGIFKAGTSIITSQAVRIADRDIDEWTRV